MNNFNGRLKSNNWRPTWIRLLFCAGRLKKENEMGILWIECLVPARESSSGESACLAGKEDCVRARHAPSLPSCLRLFRFQCQDRSIPSPGCKISGVFGPFRDLRTGLAGLLTYRNTGVRALRAINSRLRLGSFLNSLELHPDDGRLRKFVGESRNIFGCVTTHEQ